MLKRKPSGRAVEVSEHQLSECGSMHPETFCKLDSIGLLYDEVMANQNINGTEEVIWVCPSEKFKRVEIISAH